MPASRRSGLLFPSLAVVLALFSACIKPTTSSDAGEDAGETAADAGPRDAGPVDAGLVDAGPGDAGCTGNFHQCGSQCAFNGSPATCGDSCTPCPTVENGTATCDGTSCSFVCDVDAGYHACGSLCVFEDGNSCGPSCMQCPAPAFAEPLCIEDGGFSCAVECDGDLMMCADGTCGNPLQAECGADAGPCCTGLCGSDNGRCCALPGSNTPCVPNSGDCQNGACSGFDTTFFQCDPTRQVCCQGPGGSCTSNDDCCSGNCTNTLGQMKCEN